MALNLIQGKQFATASWALNATTASWGLSAATASLALTAVTASYALNAGGGGTSAFLRNKTNADSTPIV